VPTQIHSLIIGPCSVSRALCLFWIPEMPPRNFVARSLIYESRLGPNLCSCPSCTTYPLSKSIGTSNNMFGTLRLEVGKNQAQYRAHTSDVSDLCGNYAVPPACEACRMKKVCPHLRPALSDIPHSTNAGLFERSSSATEINEVVVDALALVRHAYLPNPHRRRKAAKTG